MPTIVQIEYPQLPIVAEKGKYYYRGIILVKYYTKRKNQLDQEIKNSKSVLVTASTSENIQKCVWHISFI